MKGKSKNMQKSIEELKAELHDIELKIKKLTPQDSYLDNLNRSFHLGMVGGSGKNNYRLNKRRERSLDKTIEAALVLCPMYRIRDGIKKAISDIEDGTAAKRQENAITQRSRLATYWRSLKPGDELNIGNSNGNPTVKVKNRLSVVTDSGTKWTAQQVIGREAAKLI